MGLQSTLPHKSTHATGGTDALTPADIGAQPAGSYAAGTHSHTADDIVVGENEGGILVSSGAGAVWQSGSTWAQENLNPSDIGAASGSDLALKADLVNGLVPATQLPSYVDDVLEHADVAALPVTGETGKIYVTLDTGKCYRWSGSAFIEISPSPGSTDSVAEGTSNLYFTAARALAATQAALDGKASTAQGALADTALQPGDAISAASIAVGSASGGLVADLYVGLDGKVGIGTETPSEKLTVSGKIAINTTNGSITIGVDSLNRPAILGAVIDCSDTQFDGSGVWSSWFGNSFSTEEGIIFGDHQSRIEFSSRLAVYNNRIQNVGAPVDATDAATKGYADQLISNSIRSIDAASTLQLSDASNTVSATSALTITVPLNSTAAFPIGSQVLLLKTTAGEVSIAAEAGVTLQAPGSASKIASQYGMAVLLKVATDSWILGGDII